MKTNKRRGPVQSRRGPVQSNLPPVTYMMTEIQNIEGGLRCLLTRGERIKNNALIINFLNTVVMHKLLSFLSLKNTKY